VLPVPFRCVAPLPKYTSAGDQALAPALLASISTLTVKALTAEPMRQSECTPGAVPLPVFPRMLAPVSAWVVASLTTTPVPLKVSVTRVSTLPKPTIDVCPV
jgi:hypothetical protein